MGATAWTYRHWKQEAGNAINDEFVAQSSCYSTESRTSSSASWVLAETVFGVIWTAGLCRGRSSNTARSESSKEHHKHHLHLHQQLHHAPCLLSNVLSSFLQRTP